jgi:polyisoprenoid-binding protein YceI
VVDAGRSEIRFAATSRFANAVGHFSRFQGELRVDPVDPTTAASRVTVDVASLDTRNGRRDDHLRSEDFLDAARHPTATFVSTGARRDGERWLVDGQLTIRGIIRAVTLPVAVAWADGRVRVAGELRLRRHDFRVSYQSLWNPIGDEVHVSVTLLATPS